MAPLTATVADELVRIPLYTAKHGPLAVQHHEEAVVRTKAAHATVARLLGAEADEIAFTTQFSTAISLVVEGLAWRAGDEIIVTDQEHPALLAPVLNIARRRGLVVRRLAVGDQPAAMLAELDQLLTSHTRLVAVSHVTTETGTRLPAAEIAAAARARGALTLFDGAQAAGQFPVDVRALGCDFYAITGYKCVLGPYPSAALYIRRAALDLVEVTWTGSRVTTTGGVDMDSVAFIPGAERFEYGGRPFAYEAAMAAGVEQVLALGLDTVAAHARALADSLRARLAGIPGARLCSPTDPALATGIQTVALDGLPGTDASAALRERWSIVTRPALRGSSVRVSLAAFTDETDLDRLEEALRTLARGQ
jgi:selenocysteine lyase/cysteine desulfurase